MSGSLVEMSRGVGTTGMAGTSLRWLLFIQQSSLELFAWGKELPEAREGKF